MSSLIYVTGNEVKFRVAAQVMRDSGIELEQKALETPEIQSARIEEIAEFSARWACQQLSQPVAVSDAGFYIEALNGFPGPFVRYVNEWFSPEDYLNLMRGKANRRITIRECLAYCRSGEAPSLFFQNYQGVLATAPGRRQGTPMDQLFIPEGYSVPLSEIPPDEVIAYLSNSTVWQELKRYLLSS